MKVFKFGGTSVGSVANMRSVARIINNSEPKIVVLSAMSGTTDKLLEISKKHKANDFGYALTLLKQIEEKYLKTANELLTDSFLINNYTLYIKQIIKDLQKLLFKEPSYQTERIFAAHGEIITSFLFQLFLENQKIESVLLPALNFMRINDDKEPDYSLIKKKIEETIDWYPKANIYLTQGFVCRNENNEIDTFTRGGSDFTATIIGNVVNAQEIQIWSDIDGLHNNDPRFVSKTSCVSHLTYEEAEELAYFGAKVLHPTCIQPAKYKSIPVLLKNTMNPSASGTTISGTNDKTKGIKAIAAKDHITAIKITSGRMLNAYGFLKRIFEIFDNQRTPVDMITTSEVSVSMTIDNSANLNKIVDELNTIGMVDVYENQTIICVVGNFSADENGIILKILQGMKNIPIRMISYGASRNNISLLINSSDKKETLMALSNEIFNKIEQQINESSVIKEIREFQSNNVECLLN